MNVPHLRKTFVAMIAVAGTSLCPAAPASTFRISRATSGGNPGFLITRSGDGTNYAETVRYRTVELSAFAGQHFTSQSAAYTFAAGVTSKFVSVPETTPSEAAYKFQTDTKRSFLFEVTDAGGFHLAGMTRSITTGTQFTGAYVNQAVTNLVYFSNDGTMQTGLGNKYLDVSYGPSSYRQVTDAGYNQAVHTVSSPTTARPATETTRKARCTTPCPRSTRPASP